MSMNMLPERLPYDHAKFVDRADEVQLVIDKAHKLAAGQPEDKRVVIFHGARGAGKSWLLQEINYQLGQALPNVLTLYLDLFNFSNSPPNDAVQAIIGQIREAIGKKIAHLPFEIDLNDLALLAEAMVEDARRVGVLILLFDYVDESPRDMLALLEDRCLAPLAVLPQTLIVLAGRGKEYVWKAMELRLKSEERDLQNFDLSYTREQLEKQIPQPVPTADEIYPLSAGYPWSNYILGMYPNRTDALAQCLEFLLRDLPVSDEDINHLQALCVLRMFSDEMIPRMLAAYFNDPVYLAWEYRQRRQVRQELTCTTLVRWDEANGGYLIDEALGHIMEHYMYEHDRPTWERLHTTARDLFKEWAVTYPRTADRWQKEMAYHEGKLMNGPMWSPN